MNIEGRHDIEYRAYLRSLYGEDNSKSRRKLIRNLRTAMAEELTKKQLQYLTLYYVDGVKMVSIAEEMGVNKSTVSRTLKRGKSRLQKCLKYGAAGLLEDIPEE